MQTKHLARPSGMQPGKAREPFSIRQDHILMVLEVLQRRQPVSRTELAHLTGMSPTSITRIVSELISHNIACETSRDVPTRRGRRAVNLRLNSEGMYSVGIWLDRTIIRLCVINLAQEVLCRCETLINRPCTPEHMAEEAYRLFERAPLNEEQRRRIAAIGVCMPGALNPRTGVVRASGLLSWHDVDIKALFQARFPYPVCIENDVKARLIGEKARMCLDADLDVACLLVSSGIGLAVSSGAFMLRGADNEAGEISHLPSSPAQMKCFCGQSNCLRLHLAETALIQRAHLHDASIHSIEAILWAARQEQNWAIDLINDFLVHLRTMITVIDSMYNPSLIILGGSIFHQLSAKLTELLAGDHIRLGDPHDETCITGAALMAIQHAAIEKIGQSFA